MDECVPDFLIEVVQALNSLDADLGKLEERPVDAALISNAFRMFHNIKGTCGFLGLSKMGQICHATEGMLSLVRSRALPPTPYIIATLRRSVAAMRSIVEAIESSGDEGDSDGGLLAELCALHSPALSQNASIDPISLQALFATTSGPPDPSLPPVAGVTSSAMGRDPLVQMHEGFPSTGTSGQRIGDIWSMLARVTRDLASKLGKKIALVQEGADIELNRQVLNLIRDPLIHLVRNAADHGLELPEVRQASGKSRVGQIRLRAFYDGDFVVIAIEDDGRGLDAEMIRRKAAEHRLATETELLAMSDRIVFRFVLLPGFSTLDEVTSISGRGVGLDVVRNNVEAIGGDVGIESWPNKGTSFSIRIPMHREIYPSLVPSGSNASASASEIIAVL